MTREQQLQYCRVCTNRKMDLQTGLICNLTGNAADFQEKCADFSLDKIALEKFKEKIVQRQQEDADRGFFGPEKKGIQKGVLGGVLMVVIAVAWFLLGLAANRIFFYPPVLLVIGIFAIIKGAATGNLAGEKNS